MSNTTIQLRKSGQTGNTPADLAHGELAINYADGKLFYKNGIGIKSIENQKTFETINANSSLILATSPTDILNIVPGNNITISSNVTSKTITINSTATGGGGGDDTVARELAQGAFTAANTAASNTVYLQAVNDLQNTNITSVNTFAQAAYGEANTQNVINQTQNTWITNTNTFAQAAYNSANAGVTLASAAYVQANSASSNTVYLNEVNTLQNTNITSVNTLAISAFNSANAGVALATSAYDEANTQNVINQTQNTWITNTNTFAQAAYNFANTRFSSSGGTISGNVTIQNDLSVLGNVNFIGNVTSITVTGNSGQFFGYASNGHNALYAGIPVGYDFQPFTIFQASANYDGYSQINIQNINSGTDASGDYVVTADNGTENDTYIDMGIGSSQHTDPEYTLVGPNDGYLYVSGNTTTGGGDLVFGTVLPQNDVVFAAGGMNTENEQMRIIGLSNTISIIANVDSSISKSVLLGPVANVHITGGSTGQLLSTDGSGNLSFVNNTSGYTDANVKVYLESLSNVSIGLGTGVGQGINSVAIGYNAGLTTQGSSSVAIGEEAGLTTQGNNSVAIGTYAGQNGQGITSVAVGTYAGITSQGYSAIAIGTQSGQTLQGNNSVAIGLEAGNLFQGANTIAIGNKAGWEFQGDYSVAIGWNAGELSQSANSIIISANSVSPVQANTEGFFVSPVRNVSANNVLYYNPITKEITYNVASSGGDLVNAAFNTANAGVALATAAYGKANAEGTINSTQNTWITNTDTLARAAYGEANAATSVNSTQNTNITAVNTFAQAAYNTANTAGGIPSSINTRGIQTNASYFPTFVDANNATATAESLFSHGNLFFNPSTASLVSGSLRIGPWTGSTSYRAVSHTNMTGSEYMIISGDSDLNTYLSAFTNGSVIIRGGNNSTTAQLTVSTTSTTVTGSLTATGTITAQSDEKYKANWRSVSPNFIQKLSMVRSGIYDRTDIEVTQIGVSAQSLQKILPEAVLEDEEGRLSVAYGNAALVASVELSKEVIKLRADVEKYSVLFDELKTEIKRLKSKLGE